MEAAAGAAASCPARYRFDALLSTLLVLAVAVEAPEEVGDTKLGQEEEEEEDGSAVVGVVAVCGDTRGQPPASAII